MSTQAVWHGRHAASTAAYRASANHACNKNLLLVIFIVLPVLRLHAIQRVVAARNLVAHGVHVHGTSCFSLLHDHRDVNTSSQAAACLRAAHVCVTVNFAQRDCQSALPVVVVPKSTIALADVNA